MDEELKGRLEKMQEQIDDLQAKGLAMTLIAKALTLQSPAAANLLQTIEERLIVSFLGQPVPDHIAEKALAYLRQISRPIPT